LGFSLFLGKYVISKHKKSISNRRKGVTRKELVKGKEG
jgi:hypothetical protein